MLAISENLDIDKQKVLQRIGYSADCTPPARTVSLVNKQIENAYQLIKPSYSYIIRDIKSVHRSRTVIEGPIAFRSEVIARLMEQ